MPKIVPGFIGQLVCSFRAIMTLSDDDKEENRAQQLLVLDRAARKLGTLIPPSEWRPEHLPWTYTAYFEEAVEPQEELLDRFRRELEEAWFEFDPWDAIQWDSVPRA